MKNLLMFLKRRGFTFAEALIVTIIAGYCILPVIGTLHSGMQQTESFDHREKLRTLARSRINKELAAGAFDHTAINTNTSYHYIFYNTDTDPLLVSIDTEVASYDFVASQTVASVSSILYSYKVSVNVKENLTLATTSKNIDSKFVNGLSGLKALTVLAELEPNDNVLATDSFSLFSLLNIPSFSEDYIWLSNPKNCEIIAIDPISRTKVDSFLLPLDNNSKPRDDGSNDGARPWNIAVHPNKKFVAIQCKYKIKALNIDKSSPEFGTVKEIWPNNVISILGTPTSIGLSVAAYALKLADVTKDDKAKAADDRSIVFRPDGKFCYVSAHEAKEVWAFVASNTTDWHNLRLISKVSTPTASKDKHSLLHAGNDGYLYVGPRDANKAIRFPMYSPSIFSSPQDITDPDNSKEIRAIDTSSDGSELYILWKDQIITRHESSTGRRLASSTISPTPSGAVSDIKLSGDGRYLGIIDNSGATGQGGFFLLNLSTNPLINTTNFSLISDVPAIIKRGNPNNSAKKTVTEYSMFVPYTNEFVFDEGAKPYLFAADIPGLNANTYSTNIPEDRIINFAQVDKSMVAMTLRQPEYVVVGSSEGGKGYIEYVDINGMSDADPVKRQPYEPLRIALATAPVNIALTRSGEKMRVAYGPNRAGLDIFETYGARTSLNSSPEGAQWMYGVTTPNEKFDSDPTATRFVSMDYYPSATWANGYWANLPLPATIPAGYKDPSDIDLPTTWKCQDIESLTNGGVLILYLNTSTNQSLLEWIGKHQWGPYAGKYERFARWYSTANNFPPAKASNISISADDKLLAIEALGTPNQIYLYDFATNNFGRETQLDGLLADYREENDAAWNFGSVISSCSFSVANPTAANGIALKAAITASDSWLSQNSYPGNFYILATDTLIAGTNHANKRAANKRLLGYFQPDYNAMMLSIAAIDFTRFFYNFLPVVEHVSEGMESLEYAPDLLANYQAPMQIDICTTRTKHILIKSGPAAPVIIGWESDRISTGDEYSTATPVADIGDTPEAVYKSHRYYAGNFSYSLTDIPDGSANVKLHFNESFLNYAGGRTFKVLIEGSVVEASLDVWQRAGGQHRALVLNYDVMVSGGNGLQIAFEKLVENPMISGIEVKSKGEAYVGLFANPAAGATAGAVTNTIATPKESSTVDMAGWQKILTADTRPFRFKPAFLGKYPLTGTSDTITTGMKFSRDIANPILYVVEGSNDYIWCLKPGKPITPISLGALDLTDKQLVVSNDGQKLIYARNDSNKEVLIADISNPETFTFNGTLRIQSALTGFGSLIGKVPMFGSPMCLANLPFNKHKSTAKEGSYEFIATMSNMMCGINNAVVASGGIYIMGGSVVETAPATNSIYCFNPVTSFTNPIQPLVATLPRSIFMHSTVAYDDEIYVFNGYDATVSAITNLVQKFRPVTGTVMAFQEPVVGATTEFMVSNKMTGASAPFPYTVSDTGAAAMTGEEGWCAYDGNTSNAWSSTSNNQSVTYNFGQVTLAPIVNKLWVHNATTYSSYGVNGFQFHGYDGSSWTLLTSGNVPSASTGYIHNFSNTTAYQQYKFTITSNHGSSSRWAVRELRLYNKDVRRISPIGMTGYTKGTVTVSASADAAGPAWKAFDSSPTSSNEWDTDTAGTFPRWLSMNLGVPDNVNIVRILCESGSNDGIKNFNFQGSNAATPDMTAASTDWVTLPTLSGASTPKNPSNGIWNTFYFNNPTNYQHYRILCLDTYGSSEIEAWEIEFYSTTLTVAAAIQTQLTKTITDNLAPVKVKESGACMTPYGVVIAGGIVDDPRTTATTTCLVYWPHGYEYYNSSSDFSLGISRSLPPLITAVADHCLIWHKGKLYRIGGATPAGSPLTTMESFEFSTNAWTSFSNDILFRRRKAAVCSHGDEIFIFGGRSGGSALTSAAAWNPTTNVYRQIADVPKSSTYGMSAVSYGSAIYLIGGADNYNVSGSTNILKYTP